MTRSLSMHGRIAGVRLLGAQIRGEPELHGVLREFQPLHINLDCAPPVNALPGVVIDASKWRSGECDLGEHDEKIERTAQRSRWLNIYFGVFNASILFQILTRYQRLLAFAPVALENELFVRTLDAHRALHDGQKPLVLADYEHAVDVLLWTMRLAPNAALPLQWAALFHDIERLTTEADVRIEQLATDYQAFKNNHARGSARRAAEVLAACGVDELSCHEVGQLIQAHEYPHVADANRSAQILADADALSFFSLNSSGFIDYYGREHTEKKIVFTLNRMSSQARSTLHKLKLRRDVERLLQSAIVNSHRPAVNASEVAE